MIRSIVLSLRCALVAMLAVAMVCARPAMMLSHAVPGASHGCGMAMPAHHAPHTDSRCPTTDDGACCDDCLCACPIGADVSAPVVGLVATYAHVATVIAHPD
ncbi:MAG: hypothetical protein JJD97_09570, partial [Gemmatimonadaceae bacterium]|nr:hypothetical protein [Gemmatimonadaceae bacterium]